MLCESKEDLSELCCIPLSTVKGNEKFLDKIALDLFKKDTVERIWVVEDIDFYCTESQYALNCGVNFEMTRLHQILCDLYRKCDRLAMWYSSEYQDLDIITSIEDFTNRVEKYVRLPMCEVYLFVKNKG